MARVPYAGLRPMSFRAQKVLICYTCLRLLAFHRRRRDDIVSTFAPRLSEGRTRESVIHSLVLCASERPRRKSLIHIFVFCLSECRRRESVIVSSSSVFAGAQGATLSSISSYSPFPAEKTRVFYPFLRLFFPAPKARICCVYLAYPLSVA